MFENGWWGDASPTSLLDPPLPQQITSLTNRPTSRFGFSMMWGKFCHSCFEITARTALAQFGRFKNKDSVSKERFRPPNPHWVRHCQHSTRRCNADIDDFAALYSLLHVFWFEPQLPSAASAKKNLCILMLSVKQEKSEY